MKCQLRINADDFGKDENATRAIIESFRRGYINQSTLMVNMPWADRAIDLAKEEHFDGCIGLHLNLTEGRPISEQMASCAIFCDATGEYRGRIPSGEQLKAKDVQNALRVEISAQIKRYCAYELPLMHCDGHHHVQSRLPIARVLMPLLRDCGFKSIRPPNNVYANSFVPHIRSRLQSAIFRLLADQYGLTVSSYFSGWNGLTSSWCEAHQSKRIEVMVHPRYDEGGVLSDITDFRGNCGRAMCEIVELLEACR